MCAFLHHYLLSKKRWLKSYLILDRYQWKPGTIASHDASCFCRAGISLAPQHLGIATTAHQSVQQMVDGKTNQQTMKRITQTNCSSRSPGNVPVGAEHARKGSRKRPKTESYGKRDSVLPGSVEGEGECSTIQKVLQLLLSIECRTREWQ